MDYIKVNALEAGIRNYFKNTSDFHSWEVQGSATLTNDYYNGLRVAKISNYGGHLKQLFDFEEGVRYTLAAWVRTDDPNMKLEAITPFSNSSGNHHAELKSKWIRIYHNFTATESKKGYAYFTISPPGATSDLYICGCKLEKGWYLTDWSPNPNDLYEEGTWAPMLRGINNAKYSFQKGQYAKIGNKVTLWANIRANFDEVGLGTYAYVDGIPYKNSSLLETYGTLVISTKLSDISNIACAMHAKASYIILAKFGVNSHAGVALTYGTDLSQTKFNGAFTIEYLTDGTKI